MLFKKCLDLVKLLKNGPFPASFSLFLSLQYTVDSKQMFNINKFLPMTGFELRTSGIGSNRSTNWATQPLPYLVKLFDAKVICSSHGALPKNSSGRFNVSAETEKWHFGIKCQTWDKQIGRSVTIKIPATMTNFSQEDKDQTTEKSYQIRQHTNYSMLKI